MPIKVQKIIRFIPIINFITVFLWIKSIFENKVKMSSYLKSLLLLFLTFIAITIPRIVLHNFCSNEVINEIAFLISIYLYFFAFSFVAVREQEKIEKDKKTGDG